MGLDVRFVGEKWIQDKRGLVDAAGNEPGKQRDILGPAGAFEQKPTVTI